MMVSRRLVRASILAAAAAIAIGIGAPAGAAGPGCQTPMPKDVKIDAPAAGLPADQARFLGVWNGVWNGGACAVLAVQSIDAAGKVKLIYANPEYKFPSGATYIPVPASAQDLTGRIESGVLKFNSERGNPFTFTPNGDKLAATSTVRSNTHQGTFTKQ
jgi:hypothetical protein